MISPDKQFQHSNRFSLISCSSVESYLLANAHLKSEELFEFGFGHTKSCYQPVKSCIKMSVVSVTHKWSGLAGLALAARSSLTPGAGPLTRPGWASVQCGSPSLVSPQQWALARRRAGPAQLTDSPPPRFEGSSDNQERRFWDRKFLLKVSYPLQKEDPGCIFYRGWMMNSNYQPCYITI